MNKFALFHKAMKVYQTKGGIYLFRLIKTRFLKPKASSYHFIRGILQGKKGLEIGGPSSLFKDSSILPIYAHLNHLDNCNFSQETIWSVHAHTFAYHPTKPPGKQWIHDATDLSTIKNESYDFLISSHVLEHIANPIKALYEWKRILRPNGSMVIILPHKEGTFDHLRPITSLDHMIEDYENNIQEDDLTHLDEILSLHDFIEHDIGENYESFMQRSLDNVNNRALHHHVFNTHSALKLIDYVQMKIERVEAIWPMHILIVASNVATPSLHQNDLFLKQSKSNRFSSPFTSDKYG
ncbi:MAG: class I SAM-dependent methyltransferase [Alphaproteobacteria bacterium]|nr:class I SAM-dependent methyltransferase [Alphaproteobacteria bacterium]